MASSVRGYNFEKVWYESHKQDGGREGPLPSIYKHDFIVSLPGTIQYKLHENPGLLLSSSKTRTSSLDTTDWSRNYKELAHTLPSSDIIGVSSSRLLSSIIVEPATRPRLEQFMILREHEY